VGITRDEFKAIRAAFDDRSIRRGIIVAEGEYIACFPDRASWLAWALDTLFWRVSGTIVGTVPYATSVAADEPD
jgi:hypothetical protein